MARGRGSLPDRCGRTRSSLPCGGQGRPASFPCVGIARSTGDGRRLGWPGTGSRRRPRPRMATANPAAGKPPRSPLGRHNVKGPSAGPTRCPATPSLAWRCGVVACSALPAASEPFSRRRVACLWSGRTAQQRCGTPSRQGAQCGRNHGADLVRVVRRRRPVCGRPMLEAALMTVLPLR